MKFFSNNNHRTHWQWYKSFFNITILRYLVTWFAIVPLLYNLLKGINKPIAIPTANEIIIELSLSLPFDWELLWASSLFFVVALLLYQIYCPQFIKTYNSFGDYKKYLHSPRWIVWESLSVLNDKDEIEKLFNRLNAKKYVKTTDENFDKNKVEDEENHTTAYFNYNETKYALSLPILDSSNKIDEKETEIVEREIFWEVFGRFSSSKKGIRILIIILLILSGICFGIVFVQNIISGIEYLIK